MGNTQMLHPAVLNLTHSAYHVYTYMKLESCGKPTFKFPKSKWKNFISPSGFQKAKDELCRLGLIEVEQNNANLRKANVYRFSTAWKDLKSGAITVANHVHILDGPMVACMLFPRKAYMASLKTNFEIPFIRWLVRREWNRAIANGIIRQLDAPEEAENASHSIR